MKFTFRAASEIRRRLCDTAAEALSVPADHDLEVFVAIGKRGDASHLPDWARARETPNDRKPLTELVREGSFGP